MQQPAPRGLPPRIYLPIVLVIAIAFLSTIAYFVNAGFGVNGSLFGKAGASQSSAGTDGGNAAQQGSQNNVEGGGPPAAVMEQLRTLRERIATHPNDDVALTQLGDMYLASNQFAKAIPFYRRALKANPHNIAASTGLEQARSALQQQ